MSLMFFLKFTMYRRVFVRQLIWENLGVLQEEEPLKMKLGKLKLLLHYQNNQDCKQILL